MKLQIEQPYVTALVDQFPTLASLSDQLRFGNRAEVGIEQLSLNELAFLHNLYQEAGPKMQARAAQIATLQRALNDDGERFDADHLEALVPAIADYLIHNAIRGWLFRVGGSGRAMSYLITRLDYTPPGEEEAGRVMIEIKANSRGKLAVETITIRGHDVTNKSVAEILAAKGYLKETTELMVAYDEAEARYFEWRGQYGKQFSATGTGIYADDPSASHRSSDWSRKNVVILSSSGGWARLVNDENILSDRTLMLDAAGDFLGKYLRKAGKSARYDNKVEAKVEASRDSIEKGMFTELPVHGYIFMFHLDLHHHLWVHVDDMQPYQYQPELK